MPKDERGYGSDPRPLNVTPGHGADRSHDFTAHAADLLNKAKRGKHGGLARGELERMRQEIRKRGV